MDPEDFMLAAVLRAVKDPTGTPCALSPHGTTSTYPD